MEINVLSQTSALTSGAELWIVPDPEHSGWTRRIDWYLNFQLAQSLGFEQTPPSKELISLTTELEIPIPTIEVSKNAPTLVSSSHFLPNQNTVVLPFAGDLKDWLQKIATIWSSLGNPSLRIFAPQNTSTHEVKPKWMMESNKYMSVVQDQS